MNQDHPTVLTVTQLNNQVKSMLENRFNRLWIEGEVSNPKVYPSGHIYFTLKDSMSEISAVQFAGSRISGDVNFTHGMKVIAYGSPTVYLKGGRYQFIVDTLYPSGQGELWLAYEQLKKRLESEGLFAVDRKRQIPAFPKRIGVVTSESGSVLRDIIHVITRRAPHVEILIRPARVQGKDAAADIKAGIHDLNQHGQVDVIIVARGGGSLEDLWCFNDEQLAYEIYNSEIPVISAVGHETDFTIADFVADLRAPTPSAAAELAVPVRDDWLQSLDEAESRMKDAILQHIHHRQQDLDHQLDHYAFHRPGLIINEMKERFENLCNRFILLQQSLINDKSTLLEKFIHQLQLYSPLNSLGSLTTQVHHIEQRLTTVTDQMLHENGHVIQNLGDVLSKLDPNNILLRGYSVVQTTEGSIVKSWKDVDREDVVSVLLSEGKLTAQIMETNHGKER